MGDGGANTYYYDSGSSATCDGLFVLDGIGGDNSPGDTAATYAGTGTGRFIAVDQSVANARQAGAVGDGVADDSFRLQATSRAGITAGVPIVLGGSYRVTAPIVQHAGFSIPNDAKVSIVIAEPSTITVDAAAAHLASFAVIHSRVTTHQDFSITGERLTFDLNNKARAAILAVSNGDEGGGSWTGSLKGVCRIDAPVKISNVHALPADDVSHGIRAGGLFKHIKIEGAFIDEVTRDASLTASGACVGILVDQFMGSVEIRGGEISNVLTPGDINADGISLIGRLIDTADSRSGGAGIAVVEDVKFIDCQGRSVKSQCSQTRVIRPACVRQNVVSILNGHDIDFQRGGGILIEPYFEYKANGGVSPLNTNFSPVVFQVLDKPVQAYHNAWIGGVIVSEAAMLYAALIIPGATSTDSQVLIDGVSAEAQGALRTARTTMFLRGLAVFFADNVAAQPLDTYTSIIIRNTVAPNEWPVLAYNNSTPATGLDRRLAIDLQNNLNTLLDDAGTTKRAVFAPYAGSPIIDLDRYRISGSRGYQDFFAGAWILNFTAGIMPGNDFWVDLSDALFSGGPSGRPTVGLARVTTYAPIGATAEGVVDFYANDLDGNIISWRRYNGAWKRLTDLDTNVDNSADTFYTARLNYPLVKNIDSTTGSKAGYTASLLSNAGFWYAERISGSAVKVAIGTRTGIDTAGSDHLNIYSDGRVRALGPFEVGPDASNYWSHTVGATGDLTLTGVGSEGGTFSISPPVGKFIEMGSGSRKFQTGVGGFTYITSPSSGWAHGYRFRGSAGTELGGFWASGASDSANYYTVGSAFNVGLTVRHASGDVGIGTVLPSAKLHVDQPSTIAAIPTLRLNQADISEEFIRFESTVGIGNPIETVGAKTLTATHFIRVFIQGVGARYLSVGTIA